MRDGSLAKAGVRDGSPGRGGSAVVRYGLGFVLGVGCFQFLPDMPRWEIPAALVLSTGILAWFWRPAGWLLFAAMGFLWAYVHACVLLCDPFPAGYERRELQVFGRVSSLPQRVDGGTRFLFDVENTQTAEGPVAFSGLVRLSWYGEAPPVGVGEAWDLRVRLRPPHGFANPGGFDYERWLFQQRVKAVGSVRSTGGSRQGDGDLTAGYWLDRLRQGLQTHLDTVLADRPERGLVQALVLGERGGIPALTWDSLIRTGTNHLVAISGLHVGIVAGLFFLLTRQVWRLSARLCQAVAAPRAAALAGLVAALAYSGLAGFAVSTQRALIMLGVVLGALWFARNVRPFTTLMVALILVVLVDPLAVLSYGFWLSFGAVGALLYGMARHPGRSTLWWTWGRSQWVVALGLLPLLLIFFGRTSIVAPLVNLVAVPLFSLLILPLLLLATALSLAPGGEWVLQWAAALLGWLVDGLEWVSAWEGSVVSLSHRPWWSWVLALAGVVLLLAPRGLPGRWIGGLMLLPALLAEPPRPAHGELWVTLLDVGQGLSLVARTERHTLVYDTGPSLSADFDTGSAVVAPFLRHQGWDPVDLLVLSHADKDHAGGLAGLLKLARVDRILSGEPEEFDGIHLEPCAAGQAWEWDGVRFEVLAPAPDSAPEGNDSSCVVRVENAAGSLLLTGDIGEAAERRLVRERPEALNSTVLIAAHHGSAGSSTARFLEAVAPRLVLFSAGYGNRFGFPKASVLRRVERVGAKHLTTAAAGAISFRLSPRSGVVGPDLYREQEPRYWRHRPGGFGG